MPLGWQMHTIAAPPCRTQPQIGSLQGAFTGPLENANLPVLYVPFDQNRVGWFAILVRTSPVQRFGTTTRKTPKVLPAA